MRSGTNAFHGSATWVRHTNFADADNYFSNHNTDSCATAGECQSTPLRNNQFNGTIGGPIIKDKTFFFLYYEGQRYKSLAVSCRTVPSPAEIQGALADIAKSGLTVNPVGQTLLNYFPTSPTNILVAQTPTTANANGFGVKIDHKLSQNNSIAGRYIFGDSLQSAPPFAGLPAGGSNPASLFNSVAPSRAQMAGLSWTSNIGNNKILESRLGFTRFAQIIDVNNKIDPRKLGLDTGPLSPTDFGVPYVYLSPLGYGGYIGGVQGYPITTRPDQTWDWSEHFSWVKGNQPNPNDPTATCFDPVLGAGDYICLTPPGGGSIYGPSPTGQPPFDTFSIVPNFRTPRLHNFNLSVQQEIAHNNVLTVGYSGQRGRDLVLYRDLNASPLGSPCSSTDCAPFRPFTTQFPTLGHIIQATNLAHSQYDSLQVSYNQREWHGLDTQYNLTWSKCYDNNSVNRGGAGDYPQLNNPLNVADTRGLCDHDVRLNFNVGGVYSFAPIPRLGEYVGKGWQISTIYTAISGRPFTALVGGGADPSGQGLDGNAIRAAWDGTPIKYNTRNPDQYVVETLTVDGQPDPCFDNTDSSGNFLAGAPLSPFFVPCAGTVGNSRRNQLIGPGLSQWDVTVIKNTKITERVNAQFRWEVFNVLNRANFFYLPNNTLNGGSLFQITKTPDVASGNPVVAQGGPRNMNFALKLTF